MPEISFSMLCMLLSRPCRSYFAVDSKYLKSGGG